MTHQSDDSSRPEGSWDSGTQAPGKDRPTIAALVRTPWLIVVDGRLDEPEWRDAPSVKRCNSLRCPARLSTKPKYAFSLATIGYSRFRVQGSPSPPNRSAYHASRRTWGGTGAHPTQRSSKPERYSNLEGAPSKLCLGEGFPNGRCIPQEKSHFKIATDAILGWGARDGARS